MLPESEEAPIAIGAKQSRGEALGALARHVSARAAAARDGSGRLSFAEFALCCGDFERRRGGGNADAVTVSSVE